MARVPASGNPSDNSFDAPSRAGDDGTAVRCGPGPMGGSQPSKHKTPSERERKLRREDLEDESFDPEDDADFGIDNGEDESIGLDTSTGFEDAADELDLPDDEEDERWSGDSEEVDDLPGTEVDLFQGEEYGWIGEDEPVEDDDAFDPGLEEDAEPLRDDGAEGVDDDSELDDIDLGELPDIDADLDDDVAAQTVEGFEDLAGLRLMDEPSIEIAEGVLWKALPQNAVRVRTLLALPSPPSALVSCGPHVVVAARSLFKLHAQRERCEELPLPAANPTALALAEHDGELHIGVVASGRVLRSQDGGRSFNALEPPVSAAQIAFARGPHGPRLFWQGARAGLATSEPPAPELKGEVLCFHADGRRAVAALVRQQHRLRLALSSDGGKRFQLHPVPLTAAQGKPQLRVCRDAVLLCDQGEVQVGVPPAELDRVYALARGPAALSDEEDEAYVYACVPHGDELLIVRRAARSSAGAPLVVVALGRELDGEPRQLAVSYAEGGALSLFVTTDTSLVRIDASLDGEEFA